MKVLIVEDDGFKEQDITEMVAKCLPVATIEHRRSYQSGLAAAISLRPEIVLLDMSIPTFDVALNSGETGGRPRPYGGRDLLKELTRRKIGSKVIVVTQYDMFGEGQDLMTLEQLKVGLAQQFPNNYLTTVFYKSEQSEWRTAIAEALTAATSGINA